MDKRYVKAGRYLVVDLDTGETKKFIRYTGKEAKRRKQKFVQKHWKLCKRAWEGTNHWHRGAKTAIGAKVVEAARKELGYSPKTGSGDVFVMVMGCFCDHKKCKPQPLCDCGWCKNHRTP